MAFPTTDDRILEAERQLGLRLPGELRLHLLANNGGEVEADDTTWRLHPVWDSTDRKTMGRTANNILRETEVARRWVGFPSEGIAIADNGTGDRLVLMPGSDDIWLWDHETGEVAVVEVGW